MGDFELRFLIMPFVGMMMISAPAFADEKDKPLPDGIAIVGEAEVKGCAFVDLVSRSDSFVFKHMRKASRTALIRSLEAAKALGANKAVMGEISSANKETTVTLTAYRCAPGE